MMFFKKLISAFKKTRNTEVSFSDKNYYSAASDWYQEINESISVSRNRYRILSISLGILLALSLSVLTVMMPLKQYVYRLIEVNQQTGEVAQLKEIEGNQYKANWVVTHYFISQYVINRHSYSYEDIKRTFNNALSMSNKEIAEDFTQLILDTNPNSPLNLLNKDYYREVLVLGVNKLNDTTALVRFTTLTHNRNIKTDVKKEDFQAVIKWEFQNPAESLEDRDRNPLGFTVNYYQVTPINTQTN